jgi:hypothetical protein
MRRFINRSGGYVYIKKIKLALILALSLSLMLVVVQNTTSVFDDVAPGITA